MTEIERPRTNPRAGSSNPELWDPELDWYFNAFESLCGLQSIGTSGAGENLLVSPTEEEKADRKEKLKNGFLLTLLDHAKADLRSISPGEADRAAFQAMSDGTFRRGQRIWRRLTLTPFWVQLVLQRSYQERITEAGCDWGRPPLSDQEVLHAHRIYFGKTPPIQIFESAETVIVSHPKPWKNPAPCGRPHQWKENHLE